MVKKNIWKRLKKTFYKINDLEAFRKEERKFGKILLMLIKEE